MMYKALAGSTQARSTHSLFTPISLNLISDHPLNLENGTDINIWIKDQTTDPHEFQFLSVFGQLELSVRYDSSQNTFMKTVYQGTTLISLLYTDSTHHWINIQILAKSASRMEVYYWSEKEFTLEPKIIHVFDPVSNFFDTNMVIMTSTGLPGVNFAEIRAFKLDPNFCSGYTYRYRSIIDSIPSNMIKYSRIENDYFFLDAHIAGSPSASLGGDSLPFPIHQ
jgi:hypothetical protein